MSLFLFLVSFLFAFTLTWAWVFPKIVTTATTHSSSISMKFTSVMMVPSVFFMRRWGKYVRWVSDLWWVVRKIWKRLIVKIIGMMVEASKWMGLLSPWTITIMRGVVMTHWPSLVRYMKWLVIPLSSLNHGLLLAISILIALIIVLMLYGITLIILTIFLILLIIVLGFFKVRIKVLWLLSLKNSLRRTICLFGTERIKRVVFFWLSTHLTR